MARLLLASAFLGAVDPGSFAVKDFCNSTEACLLDESSLLQLRDGADADQTSVTVDLNHFIQAGGAGPGRANNMKVYEEGVAGYGVIFRQMNDGLFDLSWMETTPGSFVHNSLHASTITYPWISADSTDGPWDVINYNFPSVGAIYGDAMERLFDNWGDAQKSSWKNGVFYPSDANSGDLRCRWESDQYSCRLVGDLGTGPQGYNKDLNDDAFPAKTFVANSGAKGSAGFPTGNPYVDGNAGGGTGCHFACADSSNNPQAC